VAFKPVPETDNGYVLHPWMWTYVPILHGMTLAQTLLEPGSKYANELKTRATALRAQVLDCKTRLQKWEAHQKANPTPPESRGRKREQRPLYGVTMFEKTMGTGSS